MGAQEAVAVMGETGVGRVAVEEKVMVAKVVELAGRVAWEEVRGHWLG